MIRYPAPIVLLALLLLLLVPAVALGCSIPIRKVGPVSLRPSELRRPVQHRVEAADWGLDGTHLSSRPLLSQFVIVKGGGAAHGATYGRQSALSIDAYGPDDHGWMYFEDDDPATPACTMVGQLQWQVPRIRVKQTATQVRVAATTQRTVGDRTGCTHGPDKGVRDCPNLARSIVRLTQPLGNRELSFEVW